MAGERDLVSEILAYLTGEAERPTFDDLGASERADAENLLEEMTDALHIDFGAIPSFEDDPVAVRLGFRNGPAQSRVYGPTLRKARERAGLTQAQVATAVSGTGRTVDSFWVNELESGTWATITTAEADAIAGATGVEERTLGNPVFPGSVVDRVATAVIEEHNQLTVTRFAEPFGDAFAHRLLVSFYDLRVLLIVCEAEQERQAAVAFAAACVADADRYAAIAAVVDDEDLTTWVVRPRDVLEAYDTPAGNHTPAASDPQVVPTTLSIALGQIIEGEVLHWGSFKAPWASVAEPNDHLRAAVKEAAWKKYAASAGRVAVDRRPAYKSVDQTDLGRAHDFVTALLFGAPETVDDYLAEVGQAS